MKKLILVTLFLIMGATIMAQNNSMSVIFSPQDLGIGLRYDRETEKMPIGIYTLASYGNYAMPFECHISNHYKVGVGITLPASKDGWYTVGLSYHKYGEYDVMALADDFNTEVFNALSLDLGVKVRMNKLISGFLFDPIKWEGTFYFGINF